MKIKYRNGEAWGRIHKFLWLEVWERGCVLEVGKRKKRFIIFNRTWRERLAEYIRAINEYLRGGLK